MCTPVAFTIAHNDGNILLRWRSVPGAQNYDVYRLNNVGDPIASGTLITTVSDTTAVLANEVPSIITAFYVVIGVRP